MFELLRQTWKRVKAGRPGRRFQRQFYRGQHFTRTQIQKIAFIGGGFLLMAAGFFFLLVPGPGLLVILLGGVLIAQESLLAARALDWMEVRVRRRLAWSLYQWRRFSPALKILALVLAVAAFGALGLGAIKLLA